jgi:hypothetical protein
MAETSTAAVVQEKTEMSLNDSSSTCPEYSFDKKKSGVHSKITPGSTNKYSLIAAKDSKGGNAW